MRCFARAAVLFPWARPLDFTAPTFRTPPRTDLSTLETDVIRLVAKGFTNAEFAIAAQARQSGLANR